MRPMENNTSRLGGKEFVISSFFFFAILTLPDKQLNKLLSLARPNLLQKVSVFEKINNY